MKDCYIKVADKAMLELLFDCVIVSKKIDDYTDVHANAKLELCFYLTVPLYRKVKMIIPEYL